LVTFDPIVNSNSVEIPASYTLQYSTDSTFQTGVSSKNFPAIGSDQPWIVTGLTNNQKYYFRAAGVVGSGSSAVTGTYSAAFPAGGMVIGAPSGSLVSGKVTFAGTATGPLYVGFYDQVTGSTYATVVGSQAAPPTSPASYSINVPNGSNYFLFGIIDQNNLGVMNVPGEISNTNAQGAAAVVITGATNNEDLDLTPYSANSIAIARTQHSVRTDQSGNPSINYSINFRLNGLYKLPVAVQLHTGPSPGAIIPADYATGAFNGNIDEFDFTPSLNGAIPNSTQSYTLQVTYSDNTAETLTVPIVGVVDAFATGLSPTGTGVSVEPTFTWTYPASASSYFYQFRLQDNN
jgi:hypothetical protein